MAMFISVTASSGADADGISKNEATAILKYVDDDGTVHFMSNESVIFSVNGSSYFSNTDNKQTITVITSSLGSAMVKFSDTKAETVIITAVYEKDTDIKDAITSTFVGGASVLLPPEIEEANNDIIDYSNLGEDIHIIIPPWETMKVGDVIYAHIRELSPWDGSYIVTEGDVGSSISLLVENGREVLLPYINKELTVNYDIGGELSPDTTYIVIPADINNVTIFGHRFSYGEFGHLVAVHKSTFLPVSVVWSYDDEYKYIGERFTDIHSLKNIYVSASISGSTKNRIVIYPQNIASIGEQNSTNESAKSVVFAISSNGRLYSWGDSIAWANPPSAVMNKLNLTGVISSKNIVAVYDENNELVTWGNNSVGGEIEKTIESVDTAIINDSAVCALLKESGKIITWGNKTSGGDSDELDILSGYQSLGATRSAFCALHTDRFVRSWGEDSLGGAMPQSIKDLNNIIAIRATDGAFAVISSGGNAYIWGASDYGGNYAGELSGVVDIASTVASFAALKNNGSIVAWGNIATGGELPDNIAKLNNVVAISASDGAFTALCSDGECYAWGQKNYGGLIPSDISINMGMALTSTAGGMAVLGKNNHSVCWDRVKGYFSDLPKDVHAIYRITRYTPPDAFLLLTMDGQIAPIGDNCSVMTDIPIELSGEMRYLDYSINNCHIDSIDMENMMIEVNEGVNKLSVTIGKNNATADGVDSDKIIATVTTTDGDLVSNVNVVFHITGSGGSVFKENTTVVLVKSTDSKGYIEVEIINSSNANVTDSVDIFLQSDQGEKQTVNIIFNPKMVPFEIDNVRNENKTLGTGEPTVIWAGSKFYIQTKGGSGEIEWISKIEDNSVSLDTIGNILTVNINNAFVGEKTLQGTDKITGESVNYSFYVNDVIFPVFTPVTFQSIVQSGMQSHLPSSILYTTLYQQWGAMSVYTGWPKNGEFWTSDSTLLLAKSCNLDNGDFRDLDKNTTTLPFITYFEFKN